MPHSTSTVRSLSRALDDQFAVQPGERADHALLRIDSAARALVRRHLFGEALRNDAAPLDRVGTGLSTGRRARPGFAA